MLREVRIQRLGVIDAAVLDLSPGLNVITGETGAGKTMVVSGLGLLLGARGDAGLVRSGANALVVEGVVDVPEDHPSLARAREAGADTAGGLVLVRSVSADGRSKAHVGGRSAPVGLLAELGEMLVAVHGQADQWRLKRGDQHRLLVDDFGGPVVAEYLTAYATCFERLAALTVELVRIRGLARDRAQESEVLRVGLERIEAIDPQPGEDDSLRHEEARLAHVDGLRAAAATAYDVVSGGDGSGEGPGGGPDSGGGRVVGVHDALTTARQALSRESALDAELAALEQRVTELAYLADDLGGDLASYLASLDVDPARLAWVQERRSDLGRLTRAYGDTIDEVLAWGAAAARRLFELDGAQDRAEALEDQIATLRAELGDRAAALTAARIDAARRLSTAVTAELRHLAMGSAVIETAVEPSRHADGSPRLSPHGADDVEIRLAANAGAPPRTVAKAASGGELSRVMLAIEVVTGAGEARATPIVPTFVFDEVDAGVGGKAALDLGARLAALAQHAQVIVVTHLAQVAAYADRHLVVHKASDGRVTASGVTVLAQEERPGELARMMAGVDGSAAALDHARDLLAEARSRRSATRADERAAPSLVGETPGVA